MVIFFSKRLKLRLWQAADLIMVGFFIALAVGSIGCLLGSCEYGVPSQLPFAVTQIGVLEKRFPVQILQSLLSLAAFWYLWKSIIRFHFDGQITGIGLILLAVIKLITEPLKTPQVAIRDISITYFLCLILLISGIWLLYNRSKKSLKQDLAYPRIFGAVLDYLRQNCKFEKTTSETEMVQAKSKNVDENDLFEHIFKEFNKYDRDILRSYYIVGNSMKEIGQEYGLSESRISQLISKNKNKILNKWKYEDFAFYLGA
jgi:RNA polymerase sigma factor (sigma-70 family)